MSTNQYNALTNELVILYAKINNKMKPKDEFTYFLTGLALAGLFVTIAMLALITYINN